MVIQILVTVIAALLVLKTLLEFSKKKVRIGYFLSWTLFWALVVVVFWRPELTQQAASMLGIGRGADAVLYVGMLVVAGAIFKVYNKLEKIDRNFTLLVRRIAILEEEKKER